MTTDKIIKLRQRAIDIADESFVKRATERIQELLRTAIANGFGEEFSLYVCSGNGYSTVEIDSCPVEYDDEPGVFHDNQNVSIEEYLEEPDSYLYKITISDKAKEALTELCELCNAIEDANLTTVVTWKIYANSLKKYEWKE